MSKTKTTKYTKVGISGEIEEIEIPHKQRKKSRFGIPAHYWDLGMYLSAPLLLAVLVGQYLDRKFEKNGLFTILLLIFGTITVFYNLIKLIKENDSPRGTK